MPDEGDGLPVEEPDPEGLDDVVEEPSGFLEQVADAVGDLWSDTDQPEA